MKHINVVLLVYLHALILIGCKSEEQVEADFISGGWRISQVTYAQRGSSSPDSTVRYEKSAFEFGSCQLTASNRECYGYYTLNGHDRTSIVYGISTSDKSLFISLIDQPNAHGILFQGPFLVDKTNDNVLVLSGPASYTDKSGRFRLQALDVKLTLTR